MTLGVPFSVVYLVTCLPSNFILKEIYTTPTVLTNGRYTVDITRVYTDLRLKTEDNRLTAMVRTQWIRADVETGGVEGLGWGLEVACSWEHRASEENSNPQSHGDKAGFRGPLRVEYYMRRAAYCAAL